MITRSRQSLSTWETLILGYIHSKLLNLLLERPKLAELILDRLRAGLLNLLLALWAVHEGEVDFKCAPSMLQKLKHTTLMENVSAHQLHASLLLEFTSVADGAKLITTLLHY